METNQEKTKQLLKEWKGENYIFGVDVLDKTGEMVKEFGSQTILIIPQGIWAKPYTEKIINSLKESGVTYPEPVKGAAPNAPREDLYRIALAISETQPNSIVAIGGGSTIDAAKAASVLVSYASANIDQFFGTGLVTEMAKKTNKALLPVIPIQTASSSGSHLTKYSNITDPVKGIKKLIIDEAIIPPKAIFDYKITLNAPLTLTSDGALDGFSHCWEVFMGATGKVYYEEIKTITCIAVDLIIEYLPKVIEKPDDLEARIALGLATDLGGYAIMISKKNPQTGMIEAGGTSAGHLGSFQLVDYLSHGRACALLNPYYTVLFANAIEDQCRTLGEILKKHELINKKVDLQKLKGRRLAEVIAKGLIKFSKKINFPTTLKEASVPRKHIKIMIEAAKDPQLKTKLQNMPIPMEVEKGDVDKLMKPTLQAAYNGDLSLIL